MSSVPPIIQFDRVSYKIGGNRVLEDLSFEITIGETLVLLGESGCGKTTTLKLINRLIEPTAGVILVKGRKTTDWDTIALRRRTGYVLQDGGLFPHFTVRENVGLTLKLAELEFVKDIKGEYPVFLLRQSFPR